MDVVDLPIRGRLESIEPKLHDGYPVDGGLLEDFFLLQLWWGGGPPPF